MYHSQSRFAPITSAHEAEKAITPRRNIISLCSHYTQASTERLVNGVGNPFLSIFLWPLTTKASKVMKLWRLCLLAEDQSGCSNRKREKDESRVWGARRQTMLFQDGGGLIMMVSQPSLLTTMPRLSFFHVCPLACCCSFPLTSPACPCRLRATRETFDAWPPSLAFIEKKK